jgi:hypothetical protein
MIVGGRVCSTSTWLLTHPTIGTAQQDSGRALQDTALRRVAAMPPAGIIPVPVPATTSSKPTDREDHDLRLED